MKNQGFLLIAVLLFSGYAILARADVQTLLTLNSHEYDEFAWKYHQLSNGEWLTKNKNDRPFYFSAWENNTGRMVIGSLDFNPGESSDQIKPGTYPHIEQLKFKNHQLLSFAFDQDQFLSAFTFDLTRDAETGQDFSFEISYQLWIYDEFLNLILGDIVTENVSLHNVPGNATIYFGLEAGQNQYIANFNVKRTDDHGGNDTFRLNINGIFRDPIEPQVVPEPATLLILGLGASGAGFAVRRRGKKG